MEYLQYLEGSLYKLSNGQRFKPCYKWNTFNTKATKIYIMSWWRFKPCYKWNTFNTNCKVGYLCHFCSSVLNLVINGIPSILLCAFGSDSEYGSFKPCYKWNTFNTECSYVKPYSKTLVLNLVINGIPSIQKIRFKRCKTF